MIDIDEADLDLLEAIKARIAAGNRKAVRVLRRMKEFVPEAGWPETVPCQYGPSLLGSKTVIEYMEEHAEYRKEQHLDHKTPFFSENYLYELLGKEDARTLLSYIRQLEEALEGEL